MGQITGRLRLGIALSAVVSLLACVPSIRSHGYIPPDDVLDEIIVGIDTRASVEETAGSPSSAGLLSDSGYYYVRSTVQTVGGRAPQVTEREVLAITFDAAGVVSNIEKFGLEDGRVVALERRVTESSVVDRTFLRQLLRGLTNFGGFGS